MSNSEFGSLLRKEIHDLNNYLNKISLQAGQAKYELETKGFDFNNLENDKARLIKVLDDLEANALKIGDVLKNLSKTIKASEALVPSNGNAKGDSSVSIEPSLVAATAKKILIVDDDTDILVILKDIFSRKGYTVLTALTGKDAISYISQGLWDMILVDIQMPDVNGIEVLREAKKAQPGIKAVVLSGFVEEHRLEIEKIGCDAILNKPFSVKTLVMVLESILDGKRDDKEKLSSLIDDTRVFAKGKLLFIEPNEIMFSSKLAYFKDPKRCRGEYEVTAAFSEKDVRDKFESFRPDIVLSDIDMFRLFKLAENIEKTLCQPRDIILYGLPRSEQEKVAKLEAMSFIGGFFDPVTMAVAPAEMDKLGKIVRSAAIVHNLYSKRKEISEQAVKPEIANVPAKGFEINRSHLFSIIYSIVFFSFILLVFYANSVLLRYFNGSAVIMQAASLFLIAIYARPMEDVLVKITDRFLFQKRYSSQNMLIQASKGMVLITDTEKLLGLIAYVVKKYLRAKSVYVYRFDKNENAFILKSHRGEKIRQMKHRIENNAFLSEYLRQMKGTILRTDPVFKNELKDLDMDLCVPSFWKGELLGFLALGKRMSGEPYTKEEVNLLATLSNEASIAIKNAENFIELERFKEKERESYFQTVLALARTIDEKDPYTRGHLDEVTAYGVEVAKELSETGKLNIDIDGLRIMLLLHDIGKIGIPDALLNKNSSLNPEEWLIMKQHCEIGQRIVAPVEKLKYVGQVIRHHQEKYDGTGYPDGLKGEEIPIEARIISVVDAYHAMTSDRPYRKALSQEHALFELKNNKGTQFDPMVVDAFMRVYEKGRIRRGR